MKQLKIALIGVGGTGSELLSHLLRLHHAAKELLNIDISVTVFDPDTVSASNVVRQRFHELDIGQSKAKVLVQRVNLCGGVQWSAYQEEFRAAHLVGTFFDLVVSCVDTRQARHEIHSYMMDWKAASSWRHPKWIDCGNAHRSGQVLYGEIHNPKYPLPSVRFPELIDTSIPEDGPSCSTAEALSRQDLFINSRVALEAADLIWRQLRHKETVGSVFFDLETYTTAAL